MELWIRSQDRERITICRDLRIYKSLEKDEWCIEDCDWLGSYKTKERTLEVLDEIQEYLERECRKEEIDFEMNGVQHSSMRYAIYEMPKE